ncbi:MAG TPA: ATP-binding protein [Streptosporangiaceae bacterium]|jgi:anti-sigma regulatory factor (Ser/Thr protein kinase)|nr:ATP-binding protein [Streptosporangiaceae bacterium]
MATVEVTFTPLPAHVRTARLVATAVARRSGVPESLLDEVRLAVGEACSRAVETHRLYCPAEPIRIALTGSDGRFEIEVINAGTAPGSAVSSPGSDAALGPAGFSLAVIAGLADDVQITETPTGTSVKMSWPVAGSLAAGSPA